MTLPNALNRLRGLGEVRMWNESMDGLVRWCGSRGRHGKVTPGAMTCPVRTKWNLLRRCWGVISGFPKTREVSIDLPRCSELNENLWESHNPAKREDLYTSDDLEWLIFSFLSFHICFFFLAIFWRILLCRIWGFKSFKNWSGRSKSVAVHHWSGRPQPLQPCFYRRICFNVLEKRLPLYKLYGWHKNMIPHDLLN